MDKPAARCPDCDSDLHAIKLLDATCELWAGEGSQHIELSYAAPEAKRGFFLGVIPSLGRVKGLICPKCGRILLYAEPFPPDEFA